MNTVAAALVVVLLAALTALGDYYLKFASQESAAFTSRWYLLGVGLYVVCTAGWVLVMRHMKLAEIGVLYSIATVLLLAAIGYFSFGESLNRHEIAGVVLALISIALMVRFAS